MLRLTRTGFDMGYGERSGWHLVPIPKSPIGTTGKILEELLEYEDACFQRLFLLRAFELSDMVGALAAFLWAREVPFDLAQPTARAQNRALLLRPLGFAEGVRQVVSTLDVVHDPTHLQVLAETLIILIFDESKVLGLPVHELLSQAQLRSAIALNKEIDCP